MHTHTHWQIVNKSEYTKKRNRQEILFSIWVRSPKPVILHNLKLVDRNFWFILGVQAFIVSFLVKKEGKWKGATHISPFMYLIEDVI